MADEAPTPSPELLEDLVLANKILYRQKVVDAFGHISARHDKDPNRYLMSRYVPPGLVTSDDIVTFSLDSEPQDKRGQKYYSERYIHGEIYKHRPDVKSILHCHAPQLIPFAATGETLRPLYHMSAFLGCCGPHIPVFDIKNAAGPTDMLVRTPALGVALAESLAGSQMVLMRGHGATIVGEAVRQVVFRAIYAVQNAGLQVVAMQLGEPLYLDGEESKLASEMNNRVVDRPWSLWRAEALSEK